eukprot:jgi/Tetstr1/440089/TSEL_028447.t1
MEQSSDAAAPQQQSSEETPLASSTWDPLLHDGGDEQSGGTEGDSEVAPGSTGAHSGLEQNVAGEDTTGAAVQHSASSLVGESSGDLSRQSAEEDALEAKPGDTASGRGGSSGSDIQKMAKKQLREVTGAAKQGLMNLSSDLWHAVRRPADPSRPASKDEERVSFSALAKSHDLAKAAKMELHFGTSPDGRPNMFPEGEHGDSFLLAHDLEVQRQRSVMDSVRDDARAESTLLREMLSLVVERLGRARSSCSLYARLFADMASAESQYSKRLQSVGSEALKHTSAFTDTSLVQDGQQDTALQLPLLVARAHAQTADSLAADAESLKTMEDELNAAWKAVSSDSLRLTQDSKVALHNLSRAFNAHEAACRSVDMLVKEVEGSGRAVQLENDPWVTESLLAKAHKHLRTCLEDGRLCLDASFLKLQQLELKRTALLSRMLSGCFGCYETSGRTVHDRAVELAGAAKAAAVETDMEGVLLAASKAMDSSNALAAHQKESVESVATELFCSPEILRQGAMELWDSTDMEWVEYHFVLTRSGFLHWFISTDDIQPTDGMNLQRSSMEAGEPPIFSVLEDGHGPWFAAKRSRKVTFKAQDVEDCCEWVIAIRDICHM